MGMGGGVSQNEMDWGWGGGGFDLSVVNKWTVVRSAVNESSI